MLKIRRNRQEIEILLDVLSSLEDSDKGIWQIITCNNMNSEMWGKYRNMMIELEIIKEAKPRSKRSRFMITSRGRTLLEIIRRYQSIFLIKDV